MRAQTESDKKMRGLGMTHSTIEAFRMPVLPQSLDPAVWRFDREFTAITFGCEQFVPRFKWIHVAILDMEALGSNGRLFKTWVGMKKEKYTIIVASQNIFFFKQATFIQDKFNLFNNLIET